MWFAREQVIPWKRTERERVEENFITAWAMATPVALAQVSPIAAKVSKAIQPLIEVVQAAGYPLMILYASAGTLVLLAGNRERGLRMIKDAAIGYLALQFVPVIAQMLMEVSQAMRTN